LGVHFSAGNNNYPVLDVEISDLSEHHNAAENCSEYIYLGYLKRGVYILRLTDRDRNVVRVKITKL
jgi:hypothetical protein